MISPFELAILFAVGLITVVPLWLLCRRLGLPPALSYLAFVPGAALVVIWIMAFMPAKADYPTNSLNAG